jgi:hypothetical protein
VSFRRAALVLTAAAITFAVAGTAAATIVPQKGIAGARLLMSKAEVRDVLGNPDRVEHGTNDFGPFTIFRYRPKLSVTFQGNQEATAITTRRFREKTPKGIGRGSTEAELENAHPKAKCRTEGPGFRHCWIGRFQPGRRVTDFRIRDGKVSRVTVAFVID